MFSLNKFSLSNFLLLSPSFYFFSTSFFSNLIYCPNLLQYILYFPLYISIFPFLSLANNSDSLHLSFSFSFFHFLTISCNFLPFFNSTLYFSPIYQLYFPLSCHSSSYFLLPFPPLFSLFFLTGLDIPHVFCGYFSSLVHFLFDSYHVSLAYFFPVLTTGFVYITHLCTAVLYTHLVSN